MGVKCDIKFEQNPHGVFYAGQVMSGAVQITVDKVRKFKGGFLWLVGIDMTNKDDLVSINGFASFNFDLYHQRMDVLDYDDIRCLVILV